MHVAPDRAYLAFDRLEEAYTALGSPERFVELCRRLTDADEQVFEALWRQLGLSVDWTLAYTTIGERAVSGFSKAKERLEAAVAAARAEAAMKDGAEAEMSANSSAAGNRSPVPLPSPRAAGEWAGRNRSPSR